jgi:RND family efflux transporter MFP subunit
MNNPNTTTLQAWLRDYCSQSAAITGSVVVAATENGENIRVLAEWPERSDINQPLIDAATMALKRKLEEIVVPPVIQNEAGPQRIVQVRLGNDAAPSIIALGLNSGNENVAQGYLNDLRSLKTTIDRLANAPNNLNTGPAATLLGLQSVLLGKENLEAACLAFVNELASSFRLDRVSLGLQEDDRVRIVAISHNATFEHKQELLRRLAAAMDEAADQGATLTQPPRPDDPPYILLAHADFATRAGTSLCSLPLVDNGRVIGILALERRGALPPGHNDVIQCEHLAALAAPIIALRHKAEQPLALRLLDTLRQMGRRLTGGDARYSRLVLGGIALAALALMLIPLPYQVTAGARIEGAEQHVLVAPTDGFLKEALVRPGDTVKAGQLLAQMADQDLHLEESKWQAEFSQHENAYIAAMARADRTGFSVSRAKANEASAQLDLVRSQLERMRIVAPTDGIIVQGDLTQSLGAPVRRGDTLLTLAPQGHHRLLLEVDERDIGDIASGRQGTLALTALPGEAQRFAVERIVPVAISRDGNNIFEVEAKLAENQSGLRPGMLGVARIEADNRSLLWRLGHRGIDWLRLQLFGWGL